jgi:hypothetical protein
MFSVYTGNVTPINISCKTEKFYAQSFALLIASNIFCNFFSVNLKKKHNLKQNVIINSKQQILQEYKKICIFC